MKEALCVVGLFLFGGGWITWDSRYMIASSHFRREHARVGAAGMAFGALLMAIGVML